MPDATPLPEPRPVPTTPSSPRTNPESSPESSPDVRVTRQGRTGRITLTRPQAINALSGAMVRTIASALTAWAPDDTIDCVIVDGEGPRGFCAGGDIKAVATSALSDGGAGARSLWSGEYRMNAQIAEYQNRYGKPVITLLHGITFGGGVGLGCHAQHRVVADDTAIAMPETVIGLSPDVGGTWLLARAPGELGTHLALTGLPVGPADAIYLGLADVHTPSETLPDLAAATSWPELQELLTAKATTPKTGSLADDQAWIDRCYTGDDVAAIIDRLQADPHPNAAPAAEVLLSRSPTALQITLTAIRRSARMTDLRQTLVQDYRIMTHSLERPDSREGIRAQIVDKDRKPRWNPARVADIDPAVVARAFTAAPGGDLTFDIPD